MTEELTSHEKKVFFRYISQKLDKLVLSDYGRDERPMAEK